MSPRAAYGASQTTLAIPSAGTTGYFSSPKAGMDNGAMPRVCLRDLDRELVAKGAFDSDGTSDRMQLHVRVSVSVESTWEFPGNLDNGGIWIEE